MLTSNQPTPKLIKNRNGYWEIRFSERKSDGSGWRSRSISTRETNKSAAQAFLTEWLQAEQSAVKKAQKQDIGSIIDRYLRARGDQTERWVLKQVREFFCNYLPEDIDVDLIHRYRATKAHLKDGSVRRHLASLIAALNYSVTHKFIARTDVPVIELPPQSTRRELFLDEFQEAEFHALAMGDSIGKPQLTRVTRFVAIALDTGSRKGAIETLTWDRVDLAHGLIDFHVAGERITNKRRAKVPISDRLMPLLVRAYAERDKSLPDSKSYVIGKGAIRRAYHTFLKSTPFEWVTPHVMRHTWATLAARNGVALWDIAGVLGDDEATVRKHYLHHCPDHLRGAVNHRKFF